MTSNALPVNFVLSKPVKPGIVAAESIVRTGSLAKTISVGPVPVTPIAVPSRFALQESAKAVIV